MTLENKINEMLEDYEFVCEIIKLEPPEPLKSYAVKSKNKYITQITDSCNKYKEETGNYFTRYL